MQTAFATKPEHQHKAIGRVPGVQRRMSCGNKAGIPPFVQKKCAHCQSAGEQELKDERKLQTKLKTGTPDDEFEKQADSVADAVSGGGSSAGATAAGGAVQRKCGTCDHEGADVAESDLVIPDAGEPLSPDVRGRVEPVLGHDLQHVRVHSGPGAQAAAARLDARAFTHRNHIWLGQNQSASDTHLMAHEATHVVQQGAVASPTPAHSAATPASGGPAVAPSVQLGPVAWLEEKAWDLLEEIAPTLVPILRQGVFEWLTEQVKSAVAALVELLTKPIRTLADLATSLATHFSELIAWMRDAGAKLARGDCSALAEAAEKIEHVIEGLAAPVIDKIRSLAAKVGDFFTGLWEKISAPAAAIWKVLKDIGGTAWQKIKDFADWIWEKTARIRSWLHRAWVWFKDLLGVGDGPDGQNGLLQWAQKKAGEAWDWLKEKIEPIKKPLMVIGAILLMLSPAGPIIALGAGIGGLMMGIRWIRNNLRSKQAIIQQRGYVQGVIIPAILSASKSVTSAIQKAADFVTGKLTAVLEVLNNVVGAASGTIFNFIATAVQWIADRFKQLVNWSAEKLGALVQWIAGVLEHLPALLKPIGDALSWVGNIIIDVMQLPLMLATKVWNIIPACIRDPIVDFIVPIILRQIPLFRELAKDPAAWQKTKADISQIISTVFKDHDLLGAIKKSFLLVLRAFNIPYELLVEVVKKAATAWDVVLDNPIAFIKNCVRAVGHGFHLFGQRLRYHLTAGVEGWLLGPLAEKGIEPPKSWTEPRDLFGFALQVLGLTIEHMIELMKKRFDPTKIEKIRVWAGRMGIAWNWIKEILNPDKSPAEIAKGLFDQAVDFGKAILAGIVEWIAGQVAIEVAIMGAAAAASAGLSEIADIARRIYKAINSLARYMNQVLPVISRVLDSVVQIAAGLIEPAGQLFESALHGAMPVVIGFLADQVGLGGVGEEIRSIIESLRSRVDIAILWLIDNAKAVILSLVDTVKAGVASIMEWWTVRLQVGSGKNQHTLLFHGDQDTAELYLESTPRLLSAYIVSLRADSNFNSEKNLQAMDRIDVKIGEITALKTEVRKARSGGKPDLADSFAPQIKSGFDKIGAELSPIFVSDDYGTEANPIPLEWFGPSTSSNKYPPLYFGGKISAASRPRSQAVLKAMFEKGEKDETNSAIRPYQPTQPAKLPDGKQIGLNPNFFINQGSLVGPLSQETTEGGDKLGALIEPYGFSGSVDNMDLDHVREIQFGGLAKNDRVENLWPLNASLNRRKGSKLANATVEYPRGNPGARISTLKTIKDREFWFKVKSTE